MKHFSKTTLHILAFGALSLFASGAGTQAQKTSAAGQPPIITAARVAKREDLFPGPLYVTIGGEERKIADVAAEAWIIQGGRKVVYSGPDGAGGFEDEGQSLRIYDPVTGRHRKIMSEYVFVTKVIEVMTSTKKLALLVEMADGGLGASYLAVVDPTRGQVFSRDHVRILSRRGDTVVIGHYKEEDWEKFHENENAKVAPYKTERLNLNNILRRRVIFNKRDRDF